MAVTGMPSLVLSVNAREAFGMLVRLPDEVQKKIIPTAARASAAPQVKLARQLLRKQVKRRTGLLEKSISIRRRKAKWNKYETAMIVGPRAKVRGVDARGNKVWPIKYSHLIELGHRIAIGKTSNRSTRGEVLRHKRRNAIYGWLGREHAKSVPGRPFLKPAVEQTSARVIQIFAIRVKREMLNAKNFFKKVKP